MTTDPRTIEYDVGDAYQLRSTLRLASLGRRDPCCRISQEGAAALPGDSIAKTDESLPASDSLLTPSTHVQQTFLTPEGAVLLSAVQHGSSVRCELLGPGAEWVQPNIPGYLGLHDGIAGFQPSGVLRRVFLQYQPRLSRCPVVFHRLVQVVLQQLVSWDDAANTWRQIVQRFGVAFPGTEIHVGPIPAVLSRLGYYDLVACGALPKQARLIIELARAASRIDRLWQQDPEKLCTYLASIRGIGPWTLNYLRGFVFGSPDVVITGDYAIPHYVSYFLHRKPRSDDAEMQKLLTPYAGHRFRVVHTIMLSGVKPPRYGPKMPSARFRR